MTFTGVFAVCGWLGQGLTDVTSVFQGGYGLVGVIRANGAGSVRVRGHHLGAGQSSASTSVDTDT